MRDFNSIYHEFHPRIHRFLCCLTGESDASDLTQIVFLKVSQSIDGFRGDSSLATWIYRIARNTACDHARSSIARQWGAELQLDVIELADYISDESSPELDQACIRGEMSACVRGMVDELPDNYRIVLFLSEFDQFTNPEIAPILGLSLETVKIRLHRARARLREALQCGCNLYRDRRNELMCERKVE